MITFYNVSNAAPAFQKLANAPMGIADGWVARKVLKEVDDLYHEYHEMVKAVADKYGDTDEAAMREELQRIWDLEVKVQHLLPLEVLERASLNLTPTELLNLEPFIQEGQ